MANRGRVVILGPSAVGIQLAKRLHHKGFLLFFGGRREEQLQELCNLYPNSGYAIMDGATPESVQEAVTKAATFDKTPLSGYVYAAGSIPLKPFRAVTSNDFLDCFVLNTVSAGMGLKTAAPYLAKSPGGGSAVLFSSIAARVGFRNHAVIASAKGAIEGMTVALAAELSPTIRVNCIAPALTDTPLAAKFLGASREALGKMHPIPRVGVPDDHASLASWLLDNEESSWVTGQIFSVDGGRSAIQK